MDLIALSRRMMDSGFDLWRLSLQMAETMVASQAVIGARMAMMGAGLQEPHRMPLAEMARFMPEKVAAFGKAGSAAAKHLAPAAMDAFPADAMAMFALSERMLAASLAWWQPVHAQATSNARRLGRKRR